MPTAVVILGYSSRADGRPHPVQRWRVAVGVRAARTHRASRIVVTGGAVRNDVVEADTMAALVAQAWPDGEVVRERAARTTWENVAFSRALVDGCDTVVLASDRFHSRRAVRYWIEQFPDDATRLRRADDGRWYRSWWLRVPTTVYEALMMLRDRFVTTR